MTDLREKLARAAEAIDALQKLVAKVPPPGGEALEELSRTVHDLTRADNSPTADFRLEWYKLHRAHELEVNKASLAYEHEKLKFLAYLNGGAAAGVLTLFTGKEPREPVWPIGLAVAAWVLALVCAWVAWSRAAEGQSLVTVAYKQRRYAEERRREVSSKGSAFNDFGIEVPIPKHSKMAKTAIAQATAVAQDQVAVATAAAAKMASTSAGADENINKAAETAKKATASKDVENQIRRGAKEGWTAGWTAGWLAAWMSPTPNVDSLLAAADASRREAARLARSAECAAWASLVLFLVGAGLASYAILGHSSFVPQTSDTNHAAAGAGGTNHAATGAGGTNRATAGATGANDAAARAGG